MAANTSAASSAGRSMRRLEWSDAGWENTQDLCGYIQGKTSATLELLKVQDRHIEDDHRPGQLLVPPLPGLVNEIDLPSLAHLAGR
jgi:hypothetical protein